MGTRGRSSALKPKGPPCDSPGCNQAAALFDRAVAPPTKSEVSRPARAASLAVRSRMSREPGPRTTTLGASIADNITLRSTTIVDSAAARGDPVGVNPGTFAAIILSFRYPPPPASKALALHSTRASACWYPAASDSTRPTPPPLRDSPAPAPAPVSAPALAATPLAHAPCPPHPAHPRAGSDS